MRIHSLSVERSRRAAFRQLRISRGSTRMWRSVFKRADIFDDVYTGVFTLVNARVLVLSDVFP